MPAKTYYGLTDAQGMVLIYTALQSIVFQPGMHARKRALGTCTLAQSHERRRPRRARAAPSTR